MPSRKSTPPGPRAELRLIDHLRALGHAGRTARNLLETGKVFYMGVPTADSGRQVDPARVEIRSNAPRLRPNRDLAVIVRDAHLVVIYKPPGMLATPDRRGAPNVIGAVHRLFGSAFAVHRLDEPTSGLMLVALSASCQRQIKELLRGHAIERAYLAIVHGIFPVAPFSVRSKLVRNRGDGLRGSDPEADAEEAKEAVTHFRLVEHLGSNSSLIEARLETGRTHQVRIHLAERGFPVLGDRLYGDPATSRAVPRLALHAAVLGLRHPVTGKALRCQAPLADDLEQLRRKLAQARR